MAAWFGRGSSPEHRPNSRLHERQKIEKSRRRDLHTRTAQSEWGREQTTRFSPPRQVQRCHPYQLPPTPLTTPSTSTISVNLQIEHTRSYPMERTPSGNSIISDNTYEPEHDYTLTQSDKEAACWVEFHFRNRQPDGKQERYLRQLISRNDIDDDALHSIRAAVDSVFFYGRLSKRVIWEWSNPSDKRYQTELIGTTALRPASRGGYETLIILSKPILKDPAYDRRLVLSAFIHELIHCYLFIQCGFNARIKGGHTKGFHEIAQIIDTWVGADNNLRLCNMKANLGHFRKDWSGPRDHQREAMRDEWHRHEGCNQSPSPESWCLNSARTPRDAGVSSGYL